MNVLQVTKGALMGGGEKHVLTLLEGFKDEKINVSLAVFAEGRLSEAARELGFEVHIISKRYRGDIAPLVKLISLIKVKNIDIVHTHLISGNLYGRLAGKAARVKGVVSTLHHSHKENMGRFSMPLMQDLFFRLDIKMAALSDCIVAPSANLKSLLVKHGVKATKIVSIPNAVNVKNLNLSEEDVRACLEELSIPPDVKLVGMVGRMVSVKNFELLLKTARRVIDEGIKARFILVGDGPLRSELEKLTASLELGEHVIFTGFREDVFRIVSTFDLFVLCSKSETNPIALIEAMALKKPVIATNVGGVSEIIDHMENGWLCPPEDEIALANSITCLLNCPEKASEFGTNAYQKVVTNFSLKGVTLELLNVYAGLTH
ncbi:MAG: glycosyltransferase [Deltaproteobacteria bacterium]|nr:glycosyltransferase [Deltaproteobacteria bacterium]